MEASIRPSVHPQRTCCSSRWCLWASPDDRRVELSLQPFRSLRSGSLMASPSEAGPVIQNEPTPGSLCCLHRLASDIASFKIVGGSIVLGVFRVRWGEADRALGWGVHIIHLIIHNNLPFSVGSVYTVGLPGRCLEVSFFSCLSPPPPPMVPFTVIEALSPPPRLRPHASCCPVSSPAGPCSRCPWLPAGPSVLCGFGVPLFPAHVAPCHSISCVSFCLSLPASPPVSLPFSLLPALLCPLV